MNNLSVEKLQMYIMKKVQLNYEFQGSLHLERCFFGRSDDPLFSFTERFYSVAEFVI